MGRDIDERSDIFSLGVMLYEMLTGQAPFNGDNVNTIMYQTLNAIPLPPNQINPAVPDMLDFILVKALAKNTEDRYQKAKEFADDLRACRDTVPRSTQQINTSGEIKTPLTVSATGRIWMEDESFKSTSQRLSPAFDSTAATLRLASLTNEVEEVDELAKTLKINRPAINLADRTTIQMPAFKPASSVSIPSPSTPTPPAPIAFAAPSPTVAKSNPNMIIIVLVVLVLLAIGAFSILR